MHLKECCGVARHHQLSMMCCLSPPAGGVLTAAESANSLESVARIKQQIMVNGGVMTSMVRRLQNDGKGWAISPAENHVLS